MVNNVKQRHFSSMWDNLHSTGEFSCGSIHEFSSRLRCDDESRIPLISVKRSFIYRRDANIFTRCLWTLKIVIWILSVFEMPDKWNQSRQQYLLKLTAKISKMKWMEAEGKPLFKYKHKNIYKNSENICFGGTKIP